MRLAFNQNKGIISHHFIQSFAPNDNVTPETVHRFGVEYAKLCFPNYQVVVSTHVDKEHLHNHIIVNSCNMITGRKYYDNKETMKNNRAISDKLCRRYGVSVISSKSEFKPIDQTTMQLALKHKSWKIQLLSDLDEAKESCKSKSEFISFLKNKNYEIRYEKHITVRKIGEKKAIRVDTLAKQFGSQYTKAELEKAMGYSTNLADTNTSNLNCIVLQVARYGYMDIQSKVIKNTDNKSPVKAYATVFLNNNIAIHGFRIIDIGTDDDALCVAMPSNRNSDGKYYDMAFPTRSEVKEDIINSVIKNYVDNSSSPLADKSPVDMKITVRLHKTTAYGDNVPASGEIRLSDSFVISGIKITCHDGTIDYEMPKIKSKDGNYYDMAVPLNDRFGQLLKEKVLPEYGLLSTQILCGNINHADLTAEGEVAYKLFKNNSIAQKVINQLSEREIKYSAKINARETTICFLKSDFETVREISLNAASETEKSHQKL